MKVKLKNTLYYNDFYGEVTDKKQEFYKLMARKDEIFEIMPIDSEIRENYKIVDKCWKFIAFKRNKKNWVVFQDNDELMKKWFEVVA